MVQEGPGPLGVAKGNMAYAFFLSFAWVLCEPVQKCFLVAQWRAMGGSMVTTELEVTC